jgi:hypothetical protein
VTAHAEVEEADLLRTRPRNARPARRSMLVTTLRCAAVAALAEDVIMHDSTAFIRWCCARCTGTACPPRWVAPPPWLPRAQAPLDLRRLSVVPALVVEPTGCDKSTLLSQLVLEATSGTCATPTVLVRVL